MLSNKQRKQIQQLKLKKYRKQRSLFVAEGEKVVQDLIAAKFTAHQLFATKPYLEIETTQISKDQMRSITHFSSASPLLGVFHTPPSKKSLPTSFHLVLDQIKDPGNLGTLIRLCDWYGLTDLVCSPDSVDAFNPKVIQASMGSIARVHLHYVPLKNHLENVEGSIYFAHTQGQSVYEAELRPAIGALVLGSESHGISTALHSITHQALTIPKHNQLGEGVESLNVAVSAAILVHEIFRFNATQK